MKELEKILEEIEMKKKKCLDIVRVEIDPMEITIHREQYKGLRMAEDIIRKHMNDGWTPVDERLPEEEQEVWVSAKTDCVRRGTYTKHFGAEHKEGFICSDGFMWMNTANAWQPYVVPEPYRPERSV